MHDYIVYILDRVFICLDKTECAGRTERQYSFGYYSGLHSEQCGRAVINIIIIIIVLKLQHNNSV